MFTQYGYNGLLRLPAHPTQIERMLFSGEEYSDRVLAMESSDLIAYWPLWESEGVIADNLEGTAARDAAYVGVTLGQPGIGDGNTCPLFDGINDQVNIYSESLRDAFDGTEGTLFGWLKVANVGVWSDSSEDYIARLFADPVDRILLRKQTTTGLINLYYEAGDVAESINSTGNDWTDFRTTAVTWSDGGDKVELFINGSSEGSASGIGTWTNMLDSTTCVIGGHNSGSPTTAPWNGWMAHWAIWTKALSGAQILSLSSV